MLKMESQIRKFYAYAITYPLTTHVRTVRSKHFSDLDIANDIFRCFNINYPSTNKIRKKVLENIFTDWVGAEFTQGVSFGQFIELEMLYSYDEVSQ